MRRRKFHVFLAVYFLIIFFWLLFCYRQVQKACVEAGHTAQSSEEGSVIYWPGEKEFAERAERGDSFWGNRVEEDETESEKGTAEETEEKLTENKENRLDEKECSDDAEEAQEKEKDTETIRIVLLGTGGIYHGKVVLEAGGETLEITEDSPYFEKTDIIRISTGGGEREIQVTSLDRRCGHPFYGGILELRREDAGIVLINEVSVEEYVKGVLPSEMPSSYPLEALKAQAVCARTYAKMKQESKSYPQYDAAVDDSTACQVYRNLKTSEECDLAVEETAGEVLREEDGSYTECYYYSTSCGRGAPLSVWHGGEKDSPVLSKSEEEITLMNQEFFDYIGQEQEGHLEAEEAFYRWNYRKGKAEDEAIFDKCRERREVNARLVLAEDIKRQSETEISRDTLGNIMDMCIAERLEGGVADCLRISCEKGYLYVWGEYNIRYVLAQGGAVTLQNDTAFSANELLPSAFISLQSICNEKGNMVGYIVVGGGFGHGVGLSQNGAKHMALAGNTYQEILATYYQEKHI